MIVPRHTHPAPILGLYKTSFTQGFYRLAAPLLSAFPPEQVAITYWDAATRAQLLQAETVITSLVLGGIGEGRDAGRRFIQMMRGPSRRILIDQDDDIHATPSHGRTWQPERVALFEGMLSEADGIITTNAALAKRLAIYGPPVRVVPNYVRPDLWPAAPAPADDGDTWLLLAGSRSHLNDWREVAPVLRRLKKRYPTLRVRVICHELFPYLQNVVDDFVPWVHPERYPQAIAGAHIALCPLPASQFNVCKSPVKALEASLAGCAVLGSETQYGPVLRAAGLPHAVCSSQAWEWAITRYLDDPAARSADAAQLRRYVTERLDARQHAEAIRAAYAA